MESESTVWRSNTEIFDASVPRKLQRALLKGLFENYQQASAYCWTAFQSPQAKDLSGYYRRAKIENEWTGIEALFPLVKVTPRGYRYKTGHYNEISCGKVVLTQSCVTSSDDIPREALHRQTLAKDGQVTLFGDDQLGEAEYLYAILIHGVDVLSEKRSRPAFARIEFPDGKCKRYLPGAINLFDRFPDLVSEYVTVRDSEPVEPRRNRRWKRKGA